jgi:hypothetical protein
MSEIGKDAAGYLLITTKSLKINKNIHLMGK